MSQDIQITVYLRQDYQGKSMMLSVKHLRIKSKQMDLLLDIIQANQI